jgi:hypothetical protein
MKKIATRTLKNFPAFMRRAANAVKVGRRAKGLTGYLFEGVNGVQMVIWTGPAGGTSERHTHDFDEYAVVITGTFRGTVGGKRVKLGPGDECYIPAGTPHDGYYSANYLWNNAKSIGTVQTLLYAKTRLGGSPALDEALAGMRRFLCTPEYARRVGVMADDREHPVSEHCYQTWTGMDRQAAGFAGMTLAEMLKPGVIYLDG